MTQLLKLFSTRLKRIDAIVYGVCSGCVLSGFYLCGEAQRLGLTGWVKNEPDRTVRLVAEGPEAALQKMVDWLHIGSPYGRVDKVEVHWAEATVEFTHFEVRWYG